MDQVSDVDTESIVKGYLHDERISLQRNETNPGIGANWNYSLQFGDAPYVQYMFQDDIWYQNYLAEALRAMEDNPDVGMLSMGHNYIFEGDMPHQNSYQELTDFLAMNVADGKHEGIPFLMQWLEWGMHPNVIGEPMFVMLRRNVMDTVGKFREDMHQNLDSEYWARVLTQTNWYYRTGSYGEFRVHAAAASAQNAQAGRGMMDRARIFHAVIPLLEGNDKKRAKQIKRRQLGKMLEKFVQRYADKHIPFTERDTLESYAAKHPLLIAKGMWNYAKRHKLKK